MSASLPSRPTRVIIADDQEWIRQILTRVTQETLPLAEVVETENGQQALDAFRSGPCDFLVSNHSMPIMDGPELVRTVRRAAPELPIVMVSVHPKVESEAMAAGANWFLTKEQIMEYLPPLLRKHATGGFKTAG